MPSPRAVLRDIELLGLNPAKAHSVIKASGRLGLQRVDEDKSLTDSEHSHHEKGVSKEEILEVQKTEVVVEKDEELNEETTTTTVETKKVEIENKPEKFERVERHVEKKEVTEKTIEKTDDKEPSEEDSKEKKFDFKKKKLSLLI